MSLLFGLNNISRVTINEDPAHIIANPRALLHLGEDAPNGTSGGAGFRSWMDIGTFTHWDSDHLYVGLKARGGTNAQDAVINWGDDDGSNPAYQPDLLRFIFTAPSFYAGPQGTTDGLEVARMMPMGNVGIGNFVPLANNPLNRLSVLGNGAFGSGYASALAPANGLLIEGDTGIGTPAPTARLDVNGTARVRNLTGGPNTALVTADANGVLHSLAFNGNGSQVLFGNGTFGPAPISSGSGADNDWLGEGTGSMYAGFSNDNVSIGTSNGPGKLNVINSGFQPKGGYFENNTGASINDVTAVQGFSHAANAAINIGLWGDAEGNNQNFGVEANALKPGAQQNIAVRALASGGTTTNFGIFAQAPGGGAFNKAGWFDGDVNITGTLSTSHSSILVDHPLDPLNKYLQHAAIEGPEMMNLYSGNATTDSRGEAWVDLPSYFEAFNRDFRYQLTVVGQFAQAIVAAKVVNNRFLIRTDKPAVEVSWQVTGLRDDAYARAYPVQVEREKAGIEQGRYVSPELYKAPPEKKLFYEITH
jgi:hypothetical protein